MHINDMYMFKKDIYTLTYIHTCMHKYMNVGIHTCILTYIHAYIHIEAHVCIYIERKKSKRKGRDQGGGGEEFSTLFASVNT